MCRSSIFLFNFFRLWMTGVPGMDRVDSLAEYLVALSGPHQPAGHGHLLSCYFPLVPCHTYSRAYVFVLSHRAGVFSLSVQMRSHPEWLQKDQAAHSGQWGCYATDHPAAGRREPHHPGTTRGWRGRATWWWCRDWTCPAACLWRLTLFSLLMCANHLTMNLHWNI